MQTVFDSSGWQAAVARLVGATNAKSVAEQLVSLLCATVSNNGTSLLAFHTDAPPEVLHHSLAPNRARHYLDRYLNFFGDDAKQLAKSVRCDSAQKLADLVRRIEDTGADELSLIPTTSDPAELDRVADALGW